MSLFATYKHSLLAQLVKLRIPIQQSSADELIKDAHYQRR